MKRSEALKKLKHYMSYQNPYDDRDIEDQILDYCERIIGMLPPPEELENVAPYILYYKTKEDVSDKIGYCVNTTKEVRMLWEPEDEEK